MSVGLVLVGLGCAPAQTDIAVIEQEVRQAEIDFARAAADGDMEKFADSIAEDAVFFGATALEGRDAVVAAWGPFLDPESGVSIHWSPEVVEVATSGDLGVSRGDYRLTQVAEDGTTTALGGIFVTVWRKSPDGKWRAILDIGTPGQPIEGE